MALSQNEALRRALALRRMSRNELHRRLREHCKRHGISRRGTSYGSVQNYINDTAVPPLEVLLAAAEILNVRSEYLTQGTGEMTEDEQEVQDSLAAAPAGVPPQTIRLALRAMGEEWPEFENAPPSVQQTLVLAWAGALQRAHGESERVEAAHRIARAVRAPLQSFGIDRDQLQTADEVAYVLGMTAVLMHLQDAAADLHKTRNVRKRS
jgi:transcriptional regulator with XRE-family HTH domain